MLLWGERDRDRQRGLTEIGLAGEVQVLYSCSSSSVWREDVEAGFSLERGC